MVSSTNGDLGPADDSRLEGKAGTPLHAQPPEVEVVEETKYVSIGYDLITLYSFFSTIEFKTSTVFLHSPKS